MDKIKSYDVYSQPKYFISLSVNPSHVFGTQTVVKSFLSPR